MKVQVGKDRAGQGGSGGPGGCLNFFLRIWIEWRTWIGGQILVYLVLLNI